MTHPKIGSPPFTTDEAIGALEAVLRSPVVRILSPGENFSRLLVQAVRESGATGDLVFDAQIVAVCREHGVRSLVTEDRDFARFAGFTTERL